MEVLLLCVYLVALWTVRSQGVGGRVCVLAHLMSMVFLTATVGHYVEKVRIGVEWERRVVHRTA